MPPQSATKCASCAYGYATAADGTCTKCPEGCSDCDAATGACTYCEGYYGLVNGTCVPCAASCRVLAFSALDKPVSMGPAGMNTKGK